MHNAFLTYLSLSIIKHSKNTIDLSFIKSEQKDKHRWNYWKRDSVKNKELPLPDDLDDTACALIALTLHDDKKLSPETWMDIVQIFLLCEEKVGGPYYTWILDKETRTKNVEWQNIDIGVNANIAYLLKLNHIPCPNGLAEYIDDCIEKENYTSRYYVCKRLLLYFIARGYTGKNKEKLVSRIQKEFFKTQKNIPSHATEYLFLWLALYELDPKFLFHEKLISIEKIIYSPTPLYIETIKNGLTDTIDSETIFETLKQEYIECFSKLEKLKKEYQQRSGIYGNIRETITNIFGESNIIKSAIDRIESNDSKAATSLLPYYVYQSIKPETVVHESILQKLSIAHVFGWIAYDIADDIFDESKRAELLPLVLTCERKMFAGFISVLGENYIPFIEKYISIVDRSMFLEKQQTEISPSDKSIGHIISALSVCVLAGYTTDSVLITNIETILIHYLTARQLLDDAHDIEEDMKNNIATYPVSLIKQKNKSIKEAVYETCKEIIKHLDSAQQLIHDTHEIVSKDFFFSILQPARSAANRAVEDIDNAKKFTIV